MADEERMEQGPGHGGHEHGRGRPGGQRSDSDRPGEGRGGERGGMRRRPGGGRRKVCRFCADKALKVDSSGNCARHQRQLAVAIKRARVIALLPFSTLG